MKINQDYMEVMRRGKWINSQVYRKEVEAGVIVAFCALGCTVTFLLVVFAQIISNL